MSADSPPQPLPPEPEDAVHLLGQFHTPIIQSFLIGAATPVVAFIVFKAYRRRQRRTSVIAYVISVQYALVLLAVGVYDRQLVQNFMSQSLRAVEENFFYPSVASVALLDVCQYIAMIMADGLIVSVCFIFDLDSDLELDEIWRASNVWTRNMFIIVPLTLLTLTEAVLLFYCLHLDIVLAPLPSNDTSKRIQKIDERLYNVAMSFGVVITMTASSLIVARIYALGKMRSIRKFRTIVEVIIESALLYSIPLLIGLIDGFTGSLSLAGFIIDGMVLVMTVLAPSLLVARLLFSHSPSWADSSYLRLERLANAAPQSRNANAGPLKSPKETNEESAETLFHPEMPVRNVEGANHVGTMWRHDDTIVAMP